MQSEEEPVVYLGPRGPEFKKLIENLLKKGKIKPKYIKKLLSPEAMNEYAKAFTAASANPEQNYEIFEQLGDVSANKFIVWYAYQRFPQLMCPLGVKVVARLRINYGARKSFAMIGEKLGFWPYISATEEERGHKMKDLLEDCVESFCGCTEYILDRAFMPGVGYAIVAEILKSIFDTIQISLRYEDLYDAKTRLKELFDTFKDLGTWAYISKREDKLVTSHIYLVPKGVSKRPHERKFVNSLGYNDIEKTPLRQWREIGKGVAAKKSDAEQKAANNGLITLNRMGYIKPIAKEYAIFNKKK